MAVPGAKVASCNDVQPSYCIADKWYLSPIFFELVVLRPELVSFWIPS
jgi:hypothetical protein